MRKFLFVALMVMVALVQVHAQDINSVDGTYWNALNSDFKIGYVAGVMNTLTLVVNFLDYAEIQGYPQTQARQLIATLNDRTFALTSINSIVSLLNDYYRISGNIKRTLPEALMALCMRGI